MRERGGYRQERSPRREAINSELDEHSTRIKELLRADLVLLEEENILLKGKCKKLSELEEKVESILKQNSQLLSENQRLSKLMHQKKMDYESLKDKYDLLSTQKMGHQSESQFERKKLISEINSLGSQLKEIELIKNAQINEVKSQFQIQIQALKRQNISAQQVYEQEIRKLREQLDKREYELGDASNRLKRLASESQYDILRLKEQKEKLRNELLYLDSDRTKELDSLRIKLQANYLQQIEAIKKNHLASLDGFEVENTKLKDLLDSKCTQLELINSRTSKLKANYEDTIAVIKRQNQSLRSKMYESETMSEGQRDSLKTKLNKLHESEIADLRQNHQKYIQCLQSEISKQECALKKKNVEIEQLLKEKSSVRLMFENENRRTIEQMQALQVKLKEAEASVQETIKNCDVKLNEKEEQIRYLDQLHRDLTSNTDSEMKSLKLIIETQKQELDTERLALKEKDGVMQQSIDQLKNQNTDLKLVLTKQRGERDKKLQDLQYQLQGIIAQLKAKLDTANTKNALLDQNIGSLRDNLHNKEKEIKALEQRVKITEQRESKLQKDSDHVRAKLIKKDQKTNDMLADQKQRLEATFSFTLDNLRTDHEGAVKLEKQKLADMSDKFKQKEKQMEDLLRKYKKLRDDMQALTEQQANKKEMTLKYPGATADLMATKNMFDVYLKTRVLDICGDARGKENLPS